MLKGLEASYCVHDGKATQLWTWKSKHLMQDSQMEDTHKNSDLQEPNWEGGNLVTIMMMMMCTNQTNECRWRKKNWKNQEHFIL